MERGGRLVFFLLGVATGAAVAGFWRRRQNTRVRQMFRTKVRPDAWRPYCTKGGKDHYRAHSPERGEPQGPDWPITVLCEFCVSLQNLPAFFLEIVR